MLRFYLLMLVLLSSLSFSAQEEGSKNPLPQAPKSFVTEHSIKLNGQTFDYKAIASETYLQDENGKAVASFWTVAYLKKDVQDYSKRPITFVFNGGPGSASVWLHMGLFGPKLVKVDSDANMDDGAAPYLMKENKEMLIDLSDFVFIDPIGTGYSRVIGEGKTEDYWGLNEDANSIAKFMRTWVSKEKRWFSPKYIAGESFGTTRAAAVAQALERGGQSMALNGLILISQALDYAGSTSINDNITSYLTYLPSMAATAWYHKKAGQNKSLEDFVEECRQFTYNSYAPALYKGMLLGENEREEIAEKLAYFTSLPKDYILRSNLRILMHRFQKQLLNDRGLAVGRLDGRYKGEEIDLQSEGPHLGDPSNYQISAAYTAALNHYYASELDVEMDRPYLTSNRKVGASWNWKPVGKNQAWEPAAVNVTRRLSEAMKRNPEMKVMVASGYYDLICPFFDAEYTFSRNGFDPEKIEMFYYEAGHMMYVHDADFLKLSRDIRRFLEN